MNKAPELKTYRYNFSNSFMEILYDFSKKHEFDDRNTYKDNWKMWKEENMEAINNEQQELKRKGFDGNLEDKMYKSARYYFKKKNTFGNRKQEPKGSRKNYIGLDNELLGAMDEFMERENNFKPSESFTLFCESNRELISQEKERVISENLIKEVDFVNKIKKTYKNRYFQNINMKYNK
jgi:hypothetical protein